jgi:hypothetical protein
MNSEFKQQLVQSQDNQKFIKLLYEKQKAVGLAIQQHPKTPFLLEEKEDTLKQQLLEAWGQRLHTTCKFASGKLNQRLTVTDLMFTLLCFEYTARHGKKHTLGKLSESVSVVELYYKLRYSTVRLIKTPVPMPSMDELSSAVLFLLDPKDILDHQMKREMAKPLGLGFNLGDPSNEYKGSQYIQQLAYEDKDNSKSKDDVLVEFGEDTKEQQERDKAERIKVAQERETQLALGQCYRMASRTWFEVEYAKYVLAKYGKLEEKLPCENNGNGESEGIGIQPLEDWVLSRIRFDPSTVYKDRVGSWMFRHLTPLGSRWATQSLPETQSQTYEDQRYFEMDNMQTELPIKQWQHEIFTRKSAFLDDAKHPLHEIAVLALYTALFDSAQLLEDVKKIDKEANLDRVGTFVSKYVLFADRVSERAYAMLGNPVGVDIISQPLRRPMLVQLGGGSQGGWYIHNWIDYEHACWYKCPTVKHALMLWMYIVHTQFKGETEWGGSLREQWLCREFGFK